VTRLSSPELERLAGELHALLSGGVVQGVRAIDRDLLSLRVHAQRRTTFLGLSLLPGAAGPLLLGRRSDGDAGPRLPAVAAAFDAALSGTTVVAVSARTGDRLLLLEAESGTSRRQLACAFHGSAPNVALFVDGAASADVRGRVGHGATLEQAFPPPPARPPGAHDALLGLAEWSELLLRQRARTVGLLRVRALASRATRALAAARTLQGRRTEDLARLSDAATLRRQADALAAHLHEVRRGQARFDVPDWEGGALWVPLDPARAPAENLRRAYALAAKAERGRAQVEAALLQATEARARLETLAAEAAGTIASVEAAEGDVTPEIAAELDRIERALDEASPARRSGARRPEAEARVGHHRHVSRDGIEILVGRSAAGNEELTFRIARGNDLWLHARGAPGPHVVVRLPRGAEVPQETLLDAATLAHVLGKRGSEPKGDVAWCRVKDVSRRKGMAAGQVLLARERVIHLRVEPARVARLLAR
jgi:hypothetical protein